MRADAAIIATAGHVDHGKSTLVQSLTGRDPDTLAAERSRGLTIELGHQFLDLPDGGRISLIDVPGHEDYLGTTIVGVLASTAVLLVVAADEGWSAQTTQHVAALTALRCARVALVVTKSDRVDPSPVLADSLARLAAVGIDPLAHACVSARTRVGIPAVIEAVTALATPAGEPTPTTATPRLWVDRSFTLKGKGTIVTGTLHAGTMAVGDQLAHGDRRVRVRGMQRHDADVSSVVGPARVALNLAGGSPRDEPKGTLLTKPAQPTFTRISGGLRPIARSGDHRWPRELLVSVGTTSVAGRLRVVADRAHLVLPRPYAVQPGDTLLLRDPGGRTVLAGVQIDQVGPRPRPRPKEQSSQKLSTPVGTTAGERILLNHLDDHPWQPPTEAQLSEWEVPGARLRALGAQGTILYLGDGLALGPGVSDPAWAAIDALEQPFTPSQARQCWGTSRRVALALLNHLYRTHRLSGGREQGWYTIAAYCV